MCATSTGALRSGKLAEATNPGAGLPETWMRRPHAHHRVIDCHGWQREDTLWQIEVTLSDTKGVAMTSAAGRHIASGETVHHMHMTLVVDEQLTIQTAQARTLAAPALSCHEVEAAYGALVGLTIGPGFTRAVRERFGGVKGCTHLSELLPIAATVAIQTVVGARLAADVDTQPQLAARMVDECHTWRRDGPLSLALKARGVGTATG